MKETSHVMTNIIRNYQDLANSVIVKSASDYRFYVDKYIRSFNAFCEVFTMDIDVNNKSALITKYSEDMFSCLNEIRIIRWFFLHSLWFGFIPNIEGKYILKNLDKEVLDKVPEWLMDELIKED